jgi:hypothetical protein
MIQVFAATKAWRSSTAFQCQKQTQSDAERYKVKHGMTGNRQQWMQQRMIA